MKIEINTSVMQGTTSFGEDEIMNMMELAAGLQQLSFIMKTNQANILRNKNGKEILTLKTIENMGVALKSLAEAKDYTWIKDEMLHKA